jgi:K+-sensing histidine kinase KdpD
VKGRVRLDTPAMRVAVSVPVGVLLLYVAFTESVARPVLTAALLGVGALLAIGAVWASTRPGGVPEAGQIGAGLVGVGLLPALLVEGLATPADAFGLLFVLVVVVAAFTMDGAPRWTLLGWTLAMWLLALWWDGLRDADLLLFHLGGGVIVLATVVRTANALGDAVTAEARARADTEQRAELLARLLRVHTLERDEVLETVVDGLIDAGFDTASLRIVDGDALVLAAGRGPSQIAMPERISWEVGLPGRAVRSGRVETIEGQREAVGAQLGATTTGAVAMPFRADGRLEGVLTAVSHDHTVSENQRETVELLASLAGRAIRRAGLYEDDEATMAGLRRLEARTQDFVSTVSHELRTPLTVVQGLGQMLRTRWEDLSPDRRDDLLRRVDANASRLAQMVRSLLDTSAFEEGHIEVQPERIELAPLLGVLLHRLASVTAGHPVSVDVPEDTTVHADRALLEHVFENLLANTAKHTPQGTQVRVVARPLAGGVEVVVSDDGPGIPEADLPHVLDRFYRGGEPASRPPGGLGLGLALVRQILVAHGADLELTSEPGAGTRFAFVLPRTGDPGSTGRQGPPR